MDAGFIRMLGLFGLMLGSFSWGALVSLTERKPPAPKGGKRILALAMRRCE